MGENVVVVNVVVVVVVNLPFPPLLSSSKDSQVDVFFVDLFSSNIPLTSNCTYLTDSI